MICNTCSAPMTPMIVSWFCKACDERAAVHAVGSPARGVQYSPVKRTISPLAVPPPALLNKLIVHGWAGPFQVHTQHGLRASYVKFAGGYRIEVRSTGLTGFRAVAQTPNGPDAEICTSEGVFCGPLDEMLDAVSDWYSERINSRGA